MNNIIKLINTNPYITFWREYKTGKPARNEDGNIQYDITPGGEGILCNLIWHRRDINGDDGLNRLLDGIKNVKVTYKEFEKRKKHDDEIRANDFKDYDWDFENNAMYWHLEDVPENFTKEQLSTIPYKWRGEMDFAQSYSDITYVYLRGTGKIEMEEYYSTPEVIEVLEKWKESLERWNNLEEREKMIVEYEKENNNILKLFLKISDKKIDYTKLYIDNMYKGFIYYSQEIKEKYNIDKELLENINNIVFEKFIENNNKDNILKMIELGLVNNEKLKENKNNLINVYLFCIKKYDFLGSDYVLSKFLIDKEELFKSYDFKNIIKNVLFNALKDFCKIETINYIFLNFKIELADITYIEIKNIAIIYIYNLIDNGDLPNAINIKDKFNLQKEELDLEYLQKETLKNYIKASPYGISYDICNDYLKRLYIINNSMSEQDFAYISEEIFMDLLEKGRDSVENIYASEIYYYASNYGFEDNFFKKEKVINLLKLFFINIIKNRVYAYYDFEFYSKINLINHILEDKDIKNIINEEFLYINNNHFKYEWEIKHFKNYLGEIIKE